MFHSRKVFDCPVRRHVYTVRTPTCLPFNFSHCRCRLRPAAVRGSTSSRLYLDERSFTELQTLCESLTFIPSLVVCFTRTQIAQIGTNLGTAAHTQWSVPTPVPLNVALAVYPRGCSISTCLLSSFYSLRRLIPCRSFTSRLASGLILPAKKTSGRIRLWIKNSLYLL